MNNVKNKLKIHLNNYFKFLQNNIVQIKNFKLNFLIILLVVKKKIMLIFSIISYRSSSFHLFFILISLIIYFLLKFLIINKH